MPLQPPYLLFLGDAPDSLSIKVAQGIRDWCPHPAVGQFRLENCQADLGLPDLTLAEAVHAGAKTLVVGVANRGGLIAPAWIKVLAEALESGMDLAAGLHNKLADIPQLRETAQRLGSRLFDVRHPTETYPIASEPAEGSAFGESNLRHEKPAHIALLHRGRGLQWIQKCVLPHWQ